MYFEQSALLTIAQSLRKTTTLDEMIRVILDELLILLDAKGTYLALRQDLDENVFAEYRRGIWADNNNGHFCSDGKFPETVINEGQTYLSDNLTNDPFFCNSYTEDQVTSLACTPLIVSNKLMIGVIILGSDRPIRSIDIRILEEIADMAANAIQRVRLHEETERRTRELQELYQLSLDLAGQLDLDTLLMTIVERATSLLEAVGGFIYLCKPENSGFEIVAAKNLPAPVGTQVSWGAGLVGKVAESRQSIIIDDYKNWDRRLEIFDQVSISSVVEAPMLFRGNLIGVIGVHQYDNSNNRFNRSSANLLFMFAGQAASAIHNTRLMDEVNRQLNQLQALREIDKAITAKLDFNTTLDIILKQVASHLMVDAATILLRTSGGNQLKCMAGIGFQFLAPKDIIVEIESSVAGEAVVSQHPVTITPVHQVQDHSLFSLMIVEGFDFYCVSPLESKGKNRGVIELYHRAPFTPDEKWIKTFETFITQIAIAIENVILLEDLQRSNAELALAYNSTLEGWSNALELRDYETEGHSQRVTWLTDRLAQSLGLGQNDRAHVRRGALLHDIGKLGISDAILFKPSQLDEDEWRVMRRHPDYAFNLLSPISYLEQALDIPYCHHEKWDGSGYPRGLKETEIPLAARIFAVADVWDALTSDRPYRQAWSPKTALNYIRSQSGSHFDPQVVGAFNEFVLENDDEVTIIGYDRFSDQAMQ